LALLVYLGRFHTSNRDTDSTVRVRSGAARESKRSTGKSSVARTGTRTGNAADTRPPGFETFLFKEFEDNEPKAVWLNPGHGLMLLSLAEQFQLVRGKAWRGDANRYVAPVLGLPQLPYVNWPEYGKLATDLYKPARGVLAPGQRPVAKVYWKARPILQFANGRPFAWLDDELTDADHEHVAAVGSAGPSLLRRINPTVGLRQHDIEALRVWATSLSGPD